MSTIFKCLIVITILFVFTFPSFCRLDFCTNDEFSTKDITDYVGDQDCKCKPLLECEWSSRLQKRSDDLPNRNRLRRKVIALIRNSICDYEDRTVHCCDSSDVRKEGNFFNIVFLSDGRDRTCHHTFIATLGESQ